MTLEAAPESETMGSVPEDDGLRFEEEATGFEEVLEGEVIGFEEVLEEEVIGFEGEASASSAV